MIPKMEEIEEKIQALETKVAYLEQGVERKKRSETITSILCLAVVVINILSTSHTHINTQKTDGWDRGGHLGVRRSRPAARRDD